ncbi:hypothetical protein L596_016181 [Steinernema carpocapsae]|uniref:Uncharacterized protein n=1 Tax=Steinernema carpocapsae TaxID=34508 RepID=A0A4U5NHC1_STECR|nr:hypothetical protein L596_016181 [Steinernema carpocapsae]
MATFVGSQHDRITYLATANGQNCTFGTLPLSKFKFFYLLNLRNLLECSKMNPKSLFLVSTTYAKVNLC